MRNIEISIIIATRNREKILWETIGKACKAIENKNAEIIIINDGDSPLAIPIEFTHTITYYKNPGKGVSSARNFGVLNSKGNILFFIDDDMWINEEIIDWINAFVITEKNNNAAYCVNWEYPPSLKAMLTKLKVGRYLLSRNYHTFWGRFHQTVAQPALGLYKYNSIGSGSLVMHKEIFNRAGKYNEQMIFQGEDADLAGRLSQLQIPIYIVFDVTLQHNHSDRLEINNFLKRIYDGFGSEFNAIKTGMSIPLGNITYKGHTKAIFEFSRITEKGWIFLLNILPNHPVIAPLNNRLIGALGGLQRYKQWRNIMKS